MVYRFALIFAVIFLFFIINLVRKNKLDEKYSVLWLIFGIIMLIVSIWPNIINRVANRFNVYYPPSLMFLIGFFVIGTYIIHISIVITKQNKMIVKLTQELGILKEKIDKKENEKKER